MNYDDAKDEAVNSLSAHVDKTVAVVQTAFLAHALETAVKRVDYVAQLIVLTFPDKQPTSDLVDQVGSELRKRWPEMPDLTATLFKMSKQDADLILDLKSPSGIQALAEEGNLNALAAVTKKDYHPVIDYQIGPCGQSMRNQGMLQIHERRV
jgi:hypothetical protein